MRTVFFCCFLVLISCSSNHKNDKKEVFKRYDYRIAVSMGSFFHHPQKFVLNNLNNDVYVLSDTDFRQIKPYVLYDISYLTKLKKNDTFQIAFSKAHCDTLFNLTTSFFKNLSLSNVDTVRKRHQIIDDDAFATIELSYNGRKMTANISSVNNPDIGSNQLDTFGNFLEKFRRQ